MTETTTKRGFDVSISANSVSKPTGAGTPADALGEPKRMSESNAENLECGDRPYADEELLRRLYVEERMSQVEIAEMLGCADCTVSKYRRKYDIKRRYQDPKWLEQKYHGEGLSLPEIGDVCGVDPNTVKSQMDKHGIETRSIPESRTDGDLEKLQDRGWLESEYIDAGRGTQDIADELGVCTYTVSKYLREQGIEARPSLSAEGEENPNWGGGYDGYYGANWGRQREKAIERDGHECIVCGCSEADHEAERGRSLEVHHVQPLRTFDVPEDANDLDNLVTLCWQCHHKWEGVPLRPMTAD